MEQKRKQIEQIDIAAWEGRPAPARRSRQEILKRRRKRRRRMIAARVITAVFLLAAAAVLGVLFWKGLGWLRLQRGEASQTADLRCELIRENDSARPAIIQDYLTANPYSRPGEPLPEVKNIFVHYTANRGTSARQNRSYFENLGITGETSASAHFVIGSEGEIIQCIPLDEIAYAVKGRNYDSISIECCYLSEDGSFTDATYESLIALTGWLLKEYGLAPSDVLRHYDEGGKKCPLYYVENEQEWDGFLTDLSAFIRSGAQSAGMNL